MRRRVLQRLASGLFGGELRYDHEMGDLKLSSGGTTVKFGSQSNAVHYDFVYNFASSESAVRPFVEAGGGALLWGNINNLATTILSAKPQTTIVGLYGGGIAYEISPSFDIRVEYRGIVSKVPDFGFGSGSSLRRFVQDFARRPATGLCGPDHPGAVAPA